MESINDASIQDEHNVRDCGECVETQYDLNHNIPVALLGFKKVHTFKQSSKIVCF